MKIFFKLSAAILLISTLLLSGCGEKPHNGDYLTEVPDGLVDELNQKFDERVEKIKNTESEWKVRKGGTVWYVSSSEGDNQNDGLSPETPVKSIPKVIRMQNDGTIKPGDVILFKRGDEWHGKLSLTVSGLTLSAYGEGDKPRLLASIEVDSPEQWLETDVPGVYVYRTDVSPSKDVGQIVFDEGEAYGFRLVIDLKTDSILHAGDDNLVGNGMNTWIHKPGPYEGYKTLAKYAEEIPEADLFYCHDYLEEKVYLYSRNGNPGDLFESIEMATHGHNISVSADNITIDNLCLKYTGSHGIGSGTRKNLTVRNCEIGFIGGSIQNSSSTTRFGNAVEIYGGADGYYVYNNYIYQCFDCGPTVQWSGKLEEGQKMIEQDIAFYGNALREASLEVWLSTTDPATPTTYALLKNCRMYDNYVTGSGTGWKAYNHQKREWCSFYGGPSTNAIYKDCYMEDNYFWNNRRHLMKAVPTTTKGDLGFEWRNNTIIHPLDEGSIGYMGADPVNATGNKQYFYDKETINFLVNSGAFGVNKFYYVPGDIANRRVATSMYS